MRLLQLVLAFTLFFTALHAQRDGVLMEDYVYVTNIKSVTFHPSGEPLEVPVVYLNNSRKLVLGFDDLDNELKDFSYEIVHCNKDWTRYSQLDAIEYIDGFQNEEIDNSSPSVNTFIPYIHYSLQLPNDDLNWTISGNYLLIIYEGNQEDSDRIPVISRRFMVVDRQVSTTVQTRRPLNVSKLRTHHEFDVFVNNSNFPIIDPRNSISVTITQNNRWDNAIVNLHPKFLAGNEMTIDNTGKVSFEALKEYRQADIRSIDFVGIGVNSIDLNSYGTDALLDLGMVRNFSTFVSTKDANGNFVIGNKDGGSDDFHGDYCNVIFTLDMDKIEEEVYVVGKFTDYKADEMYRMRYYEDKGVYIAEVKLKQGYYNFYYGVDKEDGLSMVEIEGSWADTENDYQFYVYLRAPGDRYDRLIGFTTFNSNTY